MASFLICSLIDAFVYYTSNIRTVLPSPSRSPRSAQLIVAGPGRISTFLQKPTSRGHCPSPSSLPLNLKLSKYLPARCPSGAGTDPSCLRGRAPPTRSLHPNITRLLTHRPAGPTTHHPPPPPILLGSLPYYQAPPPAMWSRTESVVPREL